MSSSLIRFLCLFLSVHPFSISSHSHIRFFRFALISSTSIAAISILAIQLKDALHILLFHCKIRVVFQLLPNIYLQRQIKHHIILSKKLIHSLYHVFPAIAYLNFFPFVLNIKTSLITIVPLPDPWFFSITRLISLIVRLILFTSHVLPLCLIKLLIVIFVIFVSVLFSIVRVFAPLVTLELSRILTNVRA
jgi:hypothetical protein